EFEAGKAPGMYAAAVVEKGDLSGFREPGPVGMTRNGDQKLFLQDPTFDPPFDPDELLVVLGRVGGVGNAPDLQGFPEHPYQKAVQSPADIVPPIRLMAVGTEDFLSRLPMFEQKGLVVF